MRNYGRSYPGAFLVFEGQLPATKQTLYTVGSGKRLVIISALVVNDDTVARTFNLYINYGSGSRRKCSKDYSLDIGGSSELVITEWLSEAADLVEGEADSAAAVTCVIWGILESV